jgi:hypothetical protein
VTGRVSAVLVVGRDDQVNSVLAPVYDDELVEAVGSDDAIRS